MQYKTLALCGSAMVLAVAIACSKTPDTPTAPSSSQPAASDAAADGSTLKVSAPIPQSPVNNAQPDSLTFVATKSDFAMGIVIMGFAVVPLRAILNIVLKRIDSDRAASTN